MKYGVIIMKHKKDIQQKPTFYLVAYGQEEHTSNFCSVKY